MSVRAGVGFFSGALALAVVGAGVVPPRPSPAPVLTARATVQERPPVWSCGQVVGMDVVNGYLKPRPGAVTRPHAFYLARAMYSGRARGFGGRGGGGGWATDYPTADRVMTRVATRLSSLDACDWEFPISLADPDLRRFPFLYTVEWGRADLTDQEARGLREYLLAGGFLMVDDFWGTQEWRDFEEQFRRVLPEHQIVEVPRDHPVFRSYYQIDEEIMQVPNIRNAQAVAMGFPGATTSERDGYQAHLRGVFDESGRLIVAINWNTDLGDALEWAESPRYPLAYSTFASRMFLNFIVYAMAF
jgi:hypothetical protein